MIIFTFKGTAGEYLLKYHGIVRKTKSPYFYFI
jgi:hypothetical protein